LCESSVLAARVGEKRSDAAGDGKPDALLKLEVDEVLKQRVKKRRVKKGKLSMRRPSAVELSTEKTYVRNNLQTAAIRLPPLVGLSAHQFYELWKFGVVVVKTDGLMRSWRELFRQGERKLVIVPLQEYNGMVKAKLARRRWTRSGQYKRIIAYIEERIVEGHEYSAVCKHLDHAFHGLDEMLTFFKLKKD